MGCPAPPPRAASTARLHQTSCNPSLDNLPVVRQEVAAHLPWHCGTGNPNAMPPGKRDRSFLVCAATNGFAEQSNCEAQILSPYFGRALLVLQKKTNLDAYKMGRQVVYKMDVHQNASKKKPVYKMAFQC